MIFLSNLPYYYFFFSSRRRHTRWPRDWSSDVCSSDLYCLLSLARRHGVQAEARLDVSHRMRPVRFVLLWHSARRSEERRVGKECRSRWSQYAAKKKI